MKKRMAYLEEIDKRDRNDGTPKLQRLRQIPPETGEFLAIIASTCPEGEFIEVGTSAGYSTMWISLACIERQTKIRTFEILPEKANIARETFKESQIEQYIELVEGDAVKYLNALEHISFCFLDAEKEIYETCYRIIIPKMVKGGIIVADNAISHYEDLKVMIEKALDDNRVDSMIVPIGKGELICRRR
jgi:predicted O-methyltransferase YrrM